MKKHTSSWIKLAIAVLLIAALALCTPSALGDDGAVSNRTAAQLFAVLPDGATGPEGLTVGPDGNVYVATFGFNAGGSVTGLGQLYVFNPEGKLLRNVPVQGSSPHLLGLAFHPQTGALLVIDFGFGQVLDVDRFNGASSVFMTVTGSSGLNAMTFDSEGNVYVSDSAQGIIWKTGKSGGPGTAWVTDPLLATAGVPPFGANGMVFNHKQTILFVANTGNDTIVQIPFNHGSPGNPIGVFVNSINGADGIAIDEHDNLWVAANQSDEIDVVSPSGKLLARLGDFQGVRRGTPQGLLFPASPAFSTDGKFLYVTNLALDLRIFKLPQAVDSQWCAQVKHYTVSRIRTNFRSLGK